MAYDKGDLIRCSILIKVSDTPTDPTTLKYKVKDPAGTSTTYTYGTDAALVRDSVGAFHIDISVTLAGTYRYRWESTGTAQGAEEDTFVVQESYF